MQPPYRLRTDLARVVEGGFAYPLGIERGGMRPRKPGWSRISWNAEVTGAQTLTYTIVVSHELVRPLLYELMRLLPMRVGGILELGSRDAFREVDVFIGPPVDREQFRAAWDVFEPILLEDATLGVGASSEMPFVEVFLDPDKRILVHVDPEASGKVQGILRRFGIHRREDDEVQSPRSVSSLVVRPVLRQIPGCLCDTDHLLIELRAAWELQLDDDPTRNLDARGRDIGCTLWHGIVWVDQEDPAGRRFGQAHIWGTATSRRAMQHLVEQRIGETFEWEFREILTLDRVAFDDRPHELDALEVPLNGNQVLSCAIDAIGTTPDGWGERDG